MLDSDWTSLGDPEPDVLYISKAKMKSFTCRLPPAAEIKHVLHAVACLSDPGCCGGGWCVFREC